MYMYVISNCAFYDMINTNLKLQIFVLVGCKSHDTLNHAPPIVLHQGWTVEPTVSPTGQGACHNHRPLFYYHSKFELSTSTSTTLQICLYISRPVVYTNHLHTILSQDRWNLKDQPCLTWKTRQSSSAELDLLKSWLTQVVCKTTQLCGKLCLRNHTLCPKL